MKEKNYTLDCKWVGEVNSENIKEMAKVMVWNCCICTYKDDEVIATASASAGIDGEPYTMLVIINGKHYNFELASKRVSAKMGEEIIANILKAVEEYKNSYPDKEIKDMEKKNLKTIYVVYETVYEDGVEYYENAPYPTFAPSYARAYCQTKELAEKWVEKYKAKWVEDYEEENENDFTIEPMYLIESEEDIKI